MAQAASGQPNRFITLTVNPSAPGTPEEHLLQLSHAWKTIVKRIRRKHPKKAINYLVVVESTKRGQPHLHILFRGPYVHQSVLSRWMDELLSSPIVDIRKIKNQREVVRYVAKYVGKNPEQFGTAKRYWQTPGYQLDREEREAADHMPKSDWLVAMLSVSALATLWPLHGYRAVRESADRVTGIPPPYEGEYAR